MRPMPRTTHQPADRGQHARDTVLDTAERLMSTKGFSATSMAELIKESGVPSSSIYWHFSSKVGVLAAVMERGEVSFLGAVAAAAARPGEADPRERLLAVIDGSTRAVFAHPSFLKLYFAFLVGAEEDADIQERVRGVREQGAGGLRANLEGAYRSWGDDRAQRVAERLLPLALAYFDGIFLARQAGEIPDATQVVRDVVDSLHALALSVE